MRHLTLRQILLALVALTTFACESSNTVGPTATTATKQDSIDQLLQRTLTEKSVRATAAPQENPEMVELGRLLFYDKILSGNMDISCATCHHSLFHTSDGLPVPIGTGGQGLGPARQIGVGRNLIPRNAPDVFHHSSFSVMFADGRVSGNSATGFKSPAGNKLPAGLTNVLAVQAMFPVTSADEMRGKAGDIRVDGQPNEVAVLADNDFIGIWATLGRRVFDNAEYRALFIRAFPGVNPANFGFQHVAIAIGAFEAQVWHFPNSPFDQFLAGRTSSMSDAQKAGALIFYGKGQCYQCHSGGLLTDERFHNIAAPQVGPGKGAEAPLDFGRGRETQSASDKFAFRTPPLRNVTLTGPYMHSGAFSTLEAAVRHHLNPATSLQNYDATQLPARQNIPVHVQDSITAGILNNVDPLVGQIGPLNDSEVQLLLQFLGSLTDPAALNQSAEIPARVPSNLPVND